METNTYIDTQASQIHKVSTSLPVEWVQRRYTDIGTVLVSLCPSCRGHVLPGDCKCQFCGQELYWEDYK